MAVNVIVSEKQVSAYLSGEIDHHCARGMREEIDDAVQRVQPEILTLDFKDVTFMDSSGIGLVMGRYALMKDMGGEVQVTNLSGHIHKVMRLAGLDRLVRLENGGKAK